MEYWQYLLAGAVGILVAAVWVRSRIRKRRQRLLRDFTRKLETLLQPKETVQVICPQRGSRCILTNTRLIFEKKGSFTAFPLKSVQRLQGTAKEGGRTTVPGKMVTLTIRAEKEYLLQNTGEEFETLARLLQEQVKRQNARKKANKEKQRRGNTKESLSGA